MLLFFFLLDISWRAGSILVFFLEGHGYGELARSNTQSPHKPSVCLPKPEGGTMKVDVFMVLGVKFLENLQHTLAILVGVHE